MRSCKYCGGQIGEDKRMDSLFCSSTCKGKYHEQQKEKKGLNGLKPAPFKEPEQNMLNLDQKEESGELEPFRNLLGEDKQQQEKENLLPLPVQYINKTIQVNNLMHVWVKSDLQKARTNIQNCLKEINKLKGQIEIEKKRDGTGIYVTSGGTGAFLGYQMANGGNKTTEGEKLLGAFIGGLAGLVFGNWIDSGVQPDREKQKAANLKKMNEVLQMGLKTLAELQKQETLLLRELLGYPETVPKEQKMLNPAYLMALKEREKIKAPTEMNDNVSNLSGTDSGFQTSKTDKTDKNGSLETDKILSAKNMAAIKMKTLNFMGRWEAFLGKIQTNFFLVVHGMSGEGKTHFTIQFAKYLAENFGNVLYVSGEEGFAPTFQNKIKSLGAEVPRLFIGDFRTGEQLLNEVPNKYHFIIIDSTNNMDIDPDLMKAIRQKFKQSGFIAVAQSTKDDKIRGSYQIVHDSDITVKVKDGIATTTKNRFKEKGTQFDVFAAYKNKGKQNKPDKPDDTLDEDFRNTV